MTLEPGDIIATGTPAGVGSMQLGDRVEIQIEGIGMLSNFVKKIDRRSKMKLFLDTANLSEIKEVASWGILMA